MSITVVNSIVNWLDVAVQHGLLSITERVPDDDPGLAVDAVDDVGGLHDVDAYFLGW